MNEKDEVRSVDRWAEAVAWYSTLRAGDEERLTNAVGCAWQDWYADPENQRIFDNVSRLLTYGDVYREQPGRTRAELEEDRYDLSVPIAEWLNPRLPLEIKKRRPSAGKWWWLSGGVAVTAILVLVVLLPRRFGLSGGNSAPAVYQTDVGGLKEVHLQDGSSIILGGRTKVSVAFSAQRRSINLIEGQAWFKVVHDARRPFIVAAGDDTIKDVGTAFLVTRESDRVVVTVTEGVVEVSGRPPRAGSPAIGQALDARPVIAPVRVSRGEELAFDDDGAFIAIKSTDTRAATAWTHGRLIFKDQPLRYVIETVDRYSSRRIVVGPEASALRFTGIVFDNEIDNWLQSLEVIYPVTVEDRGAVIRIEARSPTAASR